jgi:hypothetical protein
MIHDAGVKLARSALAILAGILTLTALSFALEALADWALMRLFPGSFPTLEAIGRSPSARWFMYAYGTLSVAAGGFVAAWLAKRSPLLHAVLMGAVQAMLTVWAAAAMRDHAPLSTWAAAIIMAPPAAILGGWLFSRYRRRDRGAGAVTV